MLGRARRVVPVLRLELHLAHEVAALRQRRRLAEDALDAVEGRALQAQQLMADAQEMLAHDVQAGIRQQMMDVGDAAHQRILHRNDAEIGVAGFSPPRSRPRRWAWAWLRMRHRLARRQIGIGARLALEGDAFGVVLIDVGHDENLPRNLARSRSAGVSTLSGTLSTRATAMLMPASSARNCSSFSRCSSGEGGSATKRSSASRR